MALEVPDVCPNIVGHSTYRLGFNASALLLSKRKHVAVFCTLFVLLKNLFHVKFRPSSVSARWVISNVGGSFNIFFRTAFFSCHAYQIVVSRSFFQDNVYQLPCVPNCCEPIFFFRTTFISCHAYQTVVSRSFFLLLQDVFQLPCIPTCEPV